MMQLQIVQVLKRKDAASIIVAIVVGLILSQFLPSITNDFTRNLLGIGGSSFGSSDDGFNEAIAYPVITALLQFVLLEVLIRVYTAIAIFISRNRK